MTSDCEMVAVTDICVLVITTEISSPLICFASWSELLLHRDSSITVSIVHAQGGIVEPDQRLALEVQENTALKRKAVLSTCTSHVLDQDESA